MPTVLAVLFFHRCLIDAVRTVANAVMRKIVCNDYAIVNSTGPYGVDSGTGDFAIRGI